MIKVMCRNSTEENKRRYNSMKNKAKNAVSEAMRVERRRAVYCVEKLSILDV